MASCLAASCLAALALGCLKYKGPTLNMRTAIVRLKSIELFGDLIMLCSGYIGFI